jgi:hypothetical protein
MILGGMDGTPPIHFVILVADQEMTRVRIVNKSSAAADIYIKGSDQPFVAGLAPDGSTDLIPVPSGATTFVLRAAGSPPNSTEVAFVAPQLRPGRDVTISINGAGVATQMGITEDRPTPGLNMPLSTPAATAAATQPGYDVAGQ